MNITSTRDEIDRLCFCTRLPMAWSEGDSSHLPSVLLPAGGGGPEFLVDRVHGATQLVITGGGGAEASGGLLDEALGSVAGLAEGVEAAVEVRERHRAPGLADCGGRGVDQRVVGTNPSLSLQLQMEVRHARCIG